MVDCQDIVLFWDIGLRGGCCTKIPDGVQAGVAGALDIGFGIVTCIPDVVGGEVGLFKCKVEDSGVGFAEQVFACGYDEFEMVVWNQAVDAFFDHFAAVGDVADDTCADAVFM